jgi:hypothetical protein
MAFLPARGLGWVVVALAIAGVGFGLVMPRLTRAMTGANAVWIRHAGLVVGLLVITPVLTADLTTAGEKAKLRGISVSLDAPAPAETKLKLAIHLAPVLSQPQRELPSFTEAVASEHDPALTAIGGELDHVVQATITRAFRRSFLIAALFAVLAALTMAVSTRRLRLPAAAVLVGVALVGVELASGATTYGTRPKLYPPCAERPSQGIGLAALDFLACRLHKSREQLVADVASAGGSALDVLEQLSR